MRPMYESKDDLFNEQAVASYIAAKRPGLFWRKLPVAYPLDYAFFDGKNNLRFFAEIKCRRVASTNFPTFILSLHKWDSGNRIANGAVPVYLIVRWTDRIGSLRFRPVTRECDIRLGGRTDRKDVQDMEPVIHLPTKNFANP